MSKGRRHSLRHLSNKKADRVIEGEKALIKSLDFLPLINSGFLLHGNSHILSQLMIPEPKLWNRYFFTK